MSKSNRSLRIAVRMDRATGATPMIFAGILDHSRGRKWTLTDNATDADGVITDAPATGVAPTVRVGPPMSYADVRPSPVAAAVVAAEHFLGLGHRKAVTVGVVDDSFAQTFRAAGGITVEIEFDRSDVSLRSIHATAEAVDSSIHRKNPRLPPWRTARASALDDLGKRLAALPGPVAIYVADDATAADVVAAALALGRAVPDDVAVLGQGDDVMACELAAVPISSVDLAWRQVGRAAAARLGRLMRGQAVPAVEFVPVAAVVSRASTDALAIADADVAAAVRFIRENAGGPLRVGDILRAVDLDRRTLERRFARSLGRSPLDVLRRYRVDQAADLLRTTNRPVTEIAKACGFRLPQHLAAAFRVFRGQTPSDFRLLHRCDD